MSDAEILPNALPLTPEEIAAAEAELAATGDAKKEKVPILPVPADAPPCNFKLPDIGKPVALYPYHDADGNVLCYIARFEHKHPETGERQKKIMPVCYCELPNGNRAWRSIGIPKPRPLYNQPEIRARAEAPILVTEGEKAAEAGKLLFPDYVVTTPMHGAQSPQHTDWSPVKARIVIISTDYDAAGVAFGDVVYDLCMTAGAKRVLHLPAEELGKFELTEGKPARREEPVEQGFDIADLLAEGWTARDASTITSLINLPLPYIKQEHLRTLQGKLGNSFQLSPRGVECAKEVKDEFGNPTTTWQWFCSYLGGLYT